MAGILKKFIGNDQVDGQKILLANNQSMDARNAANSADAALFKLNTSDELELARILNGGGFEFKNAGAPTASGSLTTKTYVDAAIATAVAGASSYADAATTANITISNPGTSSFDGVTLTSGQLLLVKNQSTTSQNGLYVFNGASSALTRATSWDAASEFVKGRLIVVLAGTVNHDTIWALQAAVASLGSDPVTFEQSSGAGGISWSTPVNSDIVPDNSAAYDLGAGGLAFSDIYASGAIKDNGALAILNLNARQLCDGGGSPAIDFSNGSGIAFLNGMYISGSIATSSAVAAAIGISTNLSTFASLGVNENSGGISLVTADCTGAGSTGAINLTTGAVDTGTRGQVNVDAIRLGLTGATLLGLNTQASNPSGAAAGDVYYNTTANEIRYYDGSAWQAVGSSGGGANQTLSNLTSPTAINQNLFFDMGSPSAVSTKNYPGGGSFDLYVATGAENGATTGILHLQSGANDGGNTGDVIITTGAAAGGVPGNIQIFPGTAGSGQQVGAISITTTDADGAGGGQILIRAGTNGNANQPAVNIGGSEVVFEAATRAGVWDGAYLKAGATSGPPSGITPVNGDIHFDGSTGALNYYSNGGGGVQVPLWPKKPIKQTITLSGGDITNQYIDLAHIAHTDSIMLMVRGANNPMWEGASYEYTVNYTGGAGGNTRITFLNDLATGGASALIAGDVLQICYLWNFQ